MSKSLVDRYEQILSEDPASTVFVELAKALIDRGEHARAADVCKEGITHHTKSVVGRVLWGKALINTGKASEAMNQFDLAMKIDRENPHAYNLISEVLLHKGLYRSALPILRKAAALQPNDGRIQTWLEQTRAALAGGPKPVVSADSTSFDEQKAEATVAAATAGNTALGDDEAMPTVVMSAYNPGGEGVTQNNAVPEGELAAGSDASTTHVGVAAPQPPGRDSATQVMSAAAVGAKGAAADPFDALTAAKGADDAVIQGLTSTFDALQDGAGEAFAVKKDEPKAAPVALGSGSEEPSVIPARDLYGAPPPGTPQGGMLDDVVSAVVPMPAELRQAPREIPAPPAAPEPSAPPGRGGLLDEIPDAMEPMSSLEVPKVELNTQTTEAIAREYERELREKLAKKQAQKTFLQRNGGKLVTGALVVVVVAGVVGFLATRSKYGGKDLPTTVAEARTAINADTRAEIVRSLQSLDNASKMDADNPEVWALTGYAHALLFADHGKSDPERAAAAEALGHSGAKDAFPELALVSDWLLADGAKAAPAKQAVVASQLDKTDVHAAAGRILLADGKPDDALKRLTRAVELLKQNVRAVVTLGDYYLDQRDYESAYRLFSSEAAKASPLHPGRLLGLAEARLELGREQAEALAEIEKLNGQTGLPSVLSARREMVYARLLATQGRNADGIKVLEEASKEYGGKTFEADYGFGVAWRTVGHMKAAQEAFEAALKKDPKSEDAKEGLGRVLLARFRERELLSRLSDAESKRVAMVRGIAHVRLAEWKKARAEFDKTKMSNKYPAEAVVYLALADAGEEQADKALKFLEKLAESTKRNKSAVQVALGKVYWQKNDLKKAKAALAEAAADPLDADGNALLGELLLSLGLPDEALEPLKRAVDRNASHTPARHNLVRTQLALGQLPDALANAEAGAEDNPASFDALKDQALANLRNGKSKEADAAINKALKNETTDSEAFRIRAQVLFARGDGKSAFTALERSNKLNPKDAETFCEIGFAFLRQGAADTSAKAYEAALREDGKSVCAYVGPFHAKPFGGKEVVNKLVDMGKNQAIGAHDRALILATLARLQLNVGQLKEARDNANAAVELMPFDGTPWFGLGEVARRQKDDAKALEAYEKAALYEPSWGAVRLALADSLVKTGDQNLPRAIQEYENFLVVSQSEQDVARVRKLLPNLKKKQK